jgi:hypothetical protein
MKVSEPEIFIVIVALFGWVSYVFEPVWFGFKTATARLPPFTAAVAQALVVRSPAKKTLEKKRPLARSSRTVMARSPQPTPRQLSAAVTGVRIVTLVGPA